MIYFSVIQTSYEQRIAGYNHYKIGIATLDNRIYELDINNIVGEKSGTVTRTRDFSPTISNWAESNNLCIFKRYFNL